MKLLNCVQLFAIPWTVTYQVPPSMEFSRQEYWSVAISFPRGSSQPSYQTQVSCFIIRMISNLMIFHTIFSICQTYLCICPSRTSIQLISTIWTFSIIQDLLLFRWLSVKESTCKCRRHRKCRFVLWVGKIPWRLNWQSTPIFLPGKPDGERSLVG